jgi:hypothetical protein
VRWPPALELVGALNGFLRESPASKDVNTKAEEATPLEAVTRRQPLKTQQTEKTSYVNCRVCDLALAL